jgi:hypothetical protein
MWKLSLFNYRFSVKIIAFQDCPLYNKQKNTWVLGNTRFISRVEHDISIVRCAHSWDIMFNTRNKSGTIPHTHVLFSISTVYFRQCRNTGINGQRSPERWSLTQRISDVNRKKQIPADSSQPCKGYFKVNRVNRRITIFNIFVCARGFSRAVYAGFFRGS